MRNVFILLRRKHSPRLLNEGKEKMIKPKVVILCGGKGTRLAEETVIRPKPLVEIGGRPILWHIMQIYSHYGFKDFVLCLGYKGEILKQYFYNYHLLLNDFTINLGKNENISFHMENKNNNETDWNVTLIDTGLNALKGARTKKIEKYIDSDYFLLTYGDSVADVNINEIIKFHLAHGKIATITGVRPPSRFGDLVIENKKVLTFSEKPQASAGIINGGFFVFNKEIFDYLTTRDECDLERGALEKLAKDGELMVYEHKGSWECMDTTRDVNYLDNLWYENRAFWKVW